MYKFSIELFQNDVCTYSNWIEKSLQIIISFAACTCMYEFALTLVAEQYDWLGQIFLYNFACLSVSALAGYFIGNI